MNQQDFFNRYRYSVRTDKLGGGAFGTVYKAYDTILDKEIAIKVSEVKIMGGKEFSLMDEFRAIEGLPSHPNIANYESVYTFEMPQGIYDYALIQYYPHGNLKDIIKEKSLSIDEKVAIARQLLNGLDFLHKHRVVHRDMKPSNILVHIRKTGNTEEIIPKIADFGLSKKADQSAQSRFDNSFGGGTLEYSSPEQLRGQELRLNTDLWAYGVIVYELFTGTPLFIPQNQASGSAEREKEIFDLILYGDIENKMALLPTNWKNAVMACLIKNPEGRIKSATELFSIIDGNVKPVETGKTLIAPPEQKATYQEQKTVIMPTEPKLSEQKKQINVKTDAPKISVEPIKEIKKTKEEKAKLKKPNASVSNKKSKKGLYVSLAIGIPIIFSGGYFAINNNTKAKVPIVQPQVLPADSIVKIENPAIITKNHSAPVAKSNKAHDEPSYQSLQLDENPKTEKNKDDAWKSEYDKTWIAIKKAYIDTEYEKVINLCNAVYDKVPETAAHERNSIYNIRQECKDIITTQKNKAQWTTIFTPIGNNMVAVKKGALRGTADDTTFEERIPAQYKLIKQEGNQIQAIKENGNIDYYKLNGKPL
jgi:serine/threonine protein kinase